MGLVGFTDRSREFKIYSQLTPFLFYIEQERRSVRVHLFCHTLEPRAEQVHSAKPMSGYVDAKISEGVCHWFTITDGPMGSAHDYRKPRYEEF